MSEPTGATDPFVWWNGALCAAADVRISPFDHGLLVGDGIFETVRVYGGRPFAWRRHLDRLEHSAAGLGLGLPTRDELRVAADAVLQANPGTLAQRAASQLRLPAPKPGLNPTPRALVNLPEWFWVPRSSWKTLRQRTQAGQVWARVVARPTSTTWGSTSSA